MNHINLDDYLYELPEEQIAKFPLDRRDSSKLLLYQQGEISEKKFAELPGLLPKDSLLVFNDTRVIQARLIFHRATGAKIEIFCLEPYLVNKNIASLLKEPGKASWKCLVGNKDKWKKKETLFLEKRFKEETIILGCDIMEDLEKSSLINFHWNTSHTFAEILEIFGHTPIPPYLKRPDSPEDRFNYQTVYAQTNGAVAAPTAGLHFTPEIIGKINQLGIESTILTLHVSAGTFQPIREKNVMNHQMHHEQIIFSKKFLQQLSVSDKKLIPVGTTSLRALESLYWFGIKLSEGSDCFNIDKFYPYSQPADLPERNKILSDILTFMESGGMEELIGTTSLFIFPGYRFRLTDGLITNFHLPGSTLLLLVAALVGNDWKEMYNFAIRKNFRFLSYGDSSLILL